jgi:hypothetical protein
MNGLEEHMSKLTRVLLMAAFAMSLPQAGGATNYHEYKKFDVSGPTERVPSRCHTNLKERRNYHHCDKWREFLHHD